MTTVEKFSPMKTLLTAIGILAIGAIFYWSMAFLQRSRIKPLSLKAYAGDTNAAASLRQIGSNAIPELITQAQYHESPLQVTARKQIAKLPPRVVQLTGLWFDPPDEVSLREAAARALGEYGSDYMEAAPVLVSLLGDPEGNVRWEAARSLVKLGETVIPILIETAQDTADPGRSMAIYTLGLMGANAKNAIPTLVFGLNDTNEPVRNVSKEALKKMGPEAVVHVVKTAARGEPQARQSAAEILEHLVSSNESPITTLRKLAEDKSTATRKNAMEALGDLRPATSLSIKTLAIGLNDPEADVRVTACAALAQIGIKASTTLPELNRLRDDTDKTVSFAAGKAYDAILTSTILPGR